MKKNSRKKIKTEKRREGEKTLITAME